MTRHAERYEMGDAATWRGKREVWAVKHDDIWQIWCMDCGIRLGTVNAGNENGSLTLLERHERVFHQ